LKKYLEILLDRADRSALETEVEDELCNHIEMQAQDYERQGLSREEALERAALRFGNFAKFKKQCIKIGSQNTLLIRLMKVIFLISFLLGVLIRATISEPHVNHVADVLMMIGGLGSLLLHLKRMGSGGFRSDEKPIQLGLNERIDSHHTSFDEEGRTPFDRVRLD
jgi:hypothetical protein